MTQTDTHTPGSPTPPWTVLCVDDEPNILAALRRTLRPEGCRVLLAENGEQALQVLQQEVVDVVVSDMRMPGMDGAQLLAQVHTHWPQTTRVLLTGYADTQAAIAAINQGQVYRYISKPWDDTDLRATLSQAAERRRLLVEQTRLQALTLQQNQELARWNADLEAKVQARTVEIEKANDRLRRSFLSSIRQFSHFLEMRSSSLAGHGKRVSDLARQVARQLEWPAEEVQDLFIAGLLHDVGYVAIPEAIMNKPVGKLSPEEMVVYQKHPSYGAQAMLGVEEAQGVAQLIRHHHERHDGTGFPDGLAGHAIPRGARLLSIASTYDDLLHGHVSESKLTPEQAMLVLQRGRGTQFDPELLDVFLQWLVAQRPTERKLLLVDARQLQPGMRLGKDLVSKDGILLLSAGHQLTEDMVRRIRQFAHKEGQELVLSVVPPT